MHPHPRTGAVGRTATPDEVDNLQLVAIVQHTLVKLVAGHNLAIMFNGDQLWVQPSCLQQICDRLYVLERHPLTIDH